jgi:hypothetical protein
VSTWLPGWELGGSTPEQIVGRVSSPVIIGSSSIQIGPAPAADYWYLQGDLFPVFQGENFRVTSVVQADSQGAGDFVFNGVEWSNSAQTVIGWSTNERSVRVINQWEILTGLYSAPTNACFARLLFGTNTTDTVLSQLTATFGGTEASTLPSFGRIVMPVSPSYASLTAGSINTLSCFTEVATDYGGFFPGSGLVVIPTEGIYDLHLRLVLQCTGSWAPVCALAGGDAGMFATAGWSNTGALWGVVEARRRDFYYAGTQPQLQVYPTGGSGWRLWPSASPFGYSSFTIEEVRS